MKHYDVVIIGGGIIGASILYRLTASGIDNCLLVDQGAIGGQTTKASAGMVRVFHSDAYLAQMSAETMLALSQFRDVGYHRTGAISILPERNRAYAEKIAGYLNKARYPAQILEAEAASDLFPSIRFKPNEFVFYEPAAGSLDAHLLSKFLIHKSQEQGASVLTNQGAASLVVKNSTVVGVKTEKDQWKAKIVVNAAGPWAENLSCSIGAPLGTRLKAIQANYFEWSSSRELPCIFDYENLSYASFRSKPKESGQILIGFALNATDPTPGESPFSPEDLELAVKSLSNRLPGITSAPWLHSRRWFDAYSLSKRGNLGFVPGYRGLMAAYGWGGTGVKLSQGIAHRATSLLREQLATGNSPKNSPASPSKGLSGGPITVSS